MRIRFNRAHIISLTVFLAILGLTQFLAWQQNLMSKQRQHENLLKELGVVHDKFRSILYNDITAANTLVIMYRQYGIPANFDSVARDITQNARYVDAIQLTEKGVITHVYPLSGYENTIGINTLADSMRALEARRSIEKRSVYFVGPRQLRQGGIGILAKVPIIVNNEFKGFSIVLTKLSTITKALDISDSSSFAYTLYKKKSAPGSNDFLLSKLPPSRSGESAVIDIEEGDWQLAVSYNDRHKPPAYPLPLTLIGIALSLVTTLLVYRKLREPEMLKKIIGDKTKQLATSEKYYRTLIETSSDAIVLLDAHGKVIYQTPSAEKISGYSLSEMGQIDGLTLIHPEDRETDNREFLAFVEHPGSVMHRKHRLKHKNGSYIWVEGTYRNLLHEESVNAIVYNYTDVSEKEVALHQLTERIKELSTIYRLNDILMDEEQSVEEVFTRIVNILPAGWQFPEICAARILFDGIEYSTANYRSSAQCQVQTISLQDGRSGEVEVAYLEPCAQFDEGPFLKEERELIRTISSTIAVYFNKRANQRALQKSEANLRTIFDNTEVGYVLLDSTFSIIAFNKYMAYSYGELTGIALETGINFIDCLIDDKKENALRIYKEVMSTGQPVEYETMYTSDGQIHYVLVTVVPIVNNGHAIGLCVAANEITRIKNFELEREKMIRDLTQRNTDLEQFTHIVSHNLRGPLSIILGVIHMLEDPMPEDERNDLIGEIQKASGRLDTVIRDLNEILEVKHDISELKAPVSLATVVEDVATSIEPSIRENDAVVECNCSNPPTVSTVKSYIHSIFYNLITNSIKYRQPGIAPHIRIWSERHGDDVVIYHQDNGIGIDMLLYGKKCFQLYQRFHPEIEGKGTGLFMIKTQVEALGGKITLESSPGNGSLFTITLPAGKVS